MKLFYESNSKIFKNENALSLEYLPPEMPEREGQLKELASLLNPISKNRRARNILITGSTGTGKTSCTKYILNQLMDFTQIGIPIYINCWQFSTSHAVLSEIAERLSLPLPRRGISFDEIFNRVKEYLIKNNKILVVVLDEVDRLIANSSTEILYYLSRGDELMNGRSSVIVISNDNDLASKLDDRIRSSLLEYRMKFEKYTAFQLKRILNERAKLAFFTSAIGEEAIALCAANASKQNGDARVAISLLYQTGLNAERDNSSRLMIKHVKMAIEEVKKETDIISRHFDSLSDIEKRIINILLNGPVTSGELYSRLSDTKLSDRMFQFYINKLEESQLISSEEVKVRPKGRTKLLSLKK